MTTTAIKQALNRPVSITPLIVLRIGFGALTLFSTLRFMVKGWIHDLYVMPPFHFTYAGFAWVKPLPEEGLWLVFILVALCALAIALGFLYRLSITTFFLLFTYIELLDKAYYLNHYYFVSLFSFLLIFLPLHANFSLDTYLGIAGKRTYVPAWCLYILRLQVAIVYIYAGIAKINPDWLLHAQPLRIWLQTRTSIWGIGPLLSYTWVAYLMSWAGMLFDLTIPFWLSCPKSRPVAYLFVVIFHLLTAILFNIGVFPWAMIICTLIFFDWQITSSSFEQNHNDSPLLFARLVTAILPLFILIQLLLPLRHWLYAGNVNWQEQGFRFSWRVMLVEKTGEAIFHVTHPYTGQSWIVLPRDYLTPMQAQQMAFQPDMITQFAHFIDAQYPDDLIVTADVFVSWNGRPSQRLIPSDLDLTTSNPSYVTLPKTLEACHRLFCKGL